MSDRLSVLAEKKQEMTAQNLKALMRLRPTLIDTAAYFDVSQKTVENYLREHFDQTFSEFRECHLSHTRMSLVKMAIERAHKSDTMLIFCLKNLCEWRNEDTMSQAIQLAKILSPEIQNLSDKELKERAKKLLTMEKSA